MEPSFVEFVGAPCGHHGPYTFYKAFRYKCGAKQRILSLGEFFFVKIHDDTSFCLGEVQLLWEDKNQEGQLLSSLRLYFLPESTPEGRQTHHGEDELLAEQEKIVLRIDDLLTWVVEGVQWTGGSRPFCRDDSSISTPSGTPSAGTSTTPATPTTPKDSQYNDLVQVFTTNNNILQLSDVQKEKKEIGLEDHQFTSVRIISYSQYCRYRTMQRRLEGLEDQWLRNALVCALGGLSTSSADVRLFFCRDTTLQPELEDHPFRQDHLTPNLKGRPRKRKLTYKKEGSMDSDSNGSDEFNEMMSPFKKSSHNGLSRHLSLRKEKDCPLLPPGKDKIPAHEETFLRRLYNYMRDNNTPIGRIPTLGFKEGKKSPVDLYYFYSYTQKLGGYDEVTNKRLWKHIYDRLGGNPSNTSAATCTRRHYERLLLAFERHMRGEGNKPMPEPYRKPRRYPPFCTPRPDSTSPTIPDIEDRTDSPIPGFVVTSRKPFTAPATSSSPPPIKLNEQGLRVDSWLQNEKSELTMAQKERLWAEKRWQKNMKNMKITTNVFSPSSIIAANKNAMKTESMKRPVSPLSLSASGLSARLNPSVHSNGSGMLTNNMKHMTGIPPPNVTMNVKQQSSQYSVGMTGMKMEPSSTSTGYPLSSSSTSTGYPLSSSSTTTGYPRSSPALPSSGVKTEVKSSDSLMHSVSSMVRPPIMPLFMSSSPANGLKPEMLMSGAYGLMAVDSRTGMLYTADAAAGDKNSSVSSLMQRAGAHGLSGSSSGIGSTHSWKTEDVASTRPSVIQHTSPTTSLCNTRPSSRGIYGPPQMMMLPPPRMPIPSPVQPQYLLHSDPYLVAAAKPPAAHTQSRRSYPQNLLGLPDHHTSTPTLPPALSAGQDQPTDLSVKKNKPQSTGENLNKSRNPSAPVIDLTCHEPINLVLDSKPVSPPLAHRTTRGYSANARPLPAHGSSRQHHLMTLTSPSLSHKAQVTTVSSLSMTSSKTSQASTSTPVTQVKGHSSASGLGQPSASGLVHPAFPQMVPQVVPGSSKVPQAVTMPHMVYQSHLQTPTNSTPSTGASTGMVLPTTVKSTVAESLVAPSVTGAVTQAAGMILPPGAMMATPMQAMQFYPQWYLSNVPSVPTTTQTAQKQTNA